MNETKTQPGIFIYENDYQILCELGPEERCALIDAMMSYALGGELPDFNGSPLSSMAWKCIKPHLDHDTERYRKRVTDSEYAVYCKLADKNGVPRMSREEWENTQSNNDRYRPLTPDNDHEPNRDINRNENIKENRDRNLNSNRNENREVVTERGERLLSPVQKEQEFEAKKNEALRKLEEYRSASP